MLIVTEYLFHKRSQIWYVCCYHYCLPSSFTAYHWVWNKIYSPGSTSGTTTSYHSGQPEYISVLVGFALHNALCGIDHCLSLCPVSLCPLYFLSFVINSLVHVSSRDPLSYRGITLAPYAYKLYCCVLNNRLIEWLDEREVIKVEQNGFIKGRSTIDHISTLTSIIETRKNVNYQLLFPSYILRRHMTQYIGICYLIN